MKLNKVHRGSEERGPGHLHPGRAQHSWGSAHRAPLLFLPSQEGASLGQAPAWPRSWGLRGAEVGEVGMLQGLFCRDALDGVTFQEVLGARREAWRGQAGSAASSPGLPQTC